MDIDSLLSQIFSEKEKKQYLNLPKQKPITSIRINNLKVSKEDGLSLLKEEGFECEEFKFIKNAFIVNHSPFLIGKSFSYFLGNIYIQDLSSMIPPEILNPNENDYVLDMCAAPGSKTTQISDLMKNRGLIIANDVSSSRARFLSFNLLRMGSVNSIVTIIKGNRLGRLYFEKFDKILIDAPCSALGIIRDHPEVLKWWKFKHSKRYANTQFDLLVSGIKALKEGGIIVYSTCTIVPEENEGVIKRVLEKYPVNVEYIDIKGFKVKRGIDLPEAIRINPHENISEGFFIALLRKIDKMKKPQDELKVTLKKLRLYHKNHKEVKNYIQFLIEHFGIEENFFENFLYEKTKELRIISESSEKFEFYNYTHRGIPIIKLDGNNFSLTTWGALFLGKFATENIYQLEEKEELKDFFKKKELPLKDTTTGMKIVKYKKYPVGYGIADKLKFKPRPKLRKELIWPFVQ